MKKLIVIGTVNKKLLFTLLLAIVFIIFNIINTELNKKIGTKNIYSIITLFGQSFGIMMIRLIPYVLKYKYDKTQRRKKDTFLDYFYLSLIITSGMGLTITFQFAEIGINFNILNVTCLNEDLDIILLLILTKIFLDYKYYIHNLISIISFCIFGIIIDVILGHYSHLKPIDSIYFLDGILKTALICYMKYMMDVKFYKYWNIVFAIGSVQSIVCLIIFSFLIIYDVIDNFQFEIKYIILTIFLNLIFNGFVQFLLIVVMINILTPNHIIIPYEIGKIVAIIVSNIEAGNTNSVDFLFLIPFIFQILSLLFYLEILEFNFCGLNKNTKKNIRLREEESMLMKAEREQSFAEVGQGLIITELPRIESIVKDIHSDSIAV